VGAVLAIICEYLWVFGRIIRSVYGVVSILPTLSLFWRRMHDTGREGAWALIPVLNLIFAAGESDRDNRYGFRPRD
jgi:uncharacterized membrane protein YhaH (DUF805 family)